MRISDWSLGIGGWVFAGAMLAGCAASNIEPVDIYPEDNCAQCRMVVSDERFASEIIDYHGEVYKFDDLNCLLKFRTKRSDVKIVATYLKDYETKQWIPYEKASIIETSIETPMGSGKIAFADAEKAKAFKSQYPIAAGKDGCSAKCCD